MARHEGDMVVEMAGDIHDIESQIELFQSDALTFMYIVCDVRIVFVPSSEHWHVVYCAQFCDTADMVMMTMRAENAVQGQAMFGKKSQHGRGFAGIHHNGMSVVVYGPDVVVLEGGDGGDVEHDCLES